MPLDPVASLMMAEAGPLPGRVLVLDDAGGELSRAALATGAQVRAWCDDLREADALPDAVRVEEDPLAGFAADVVLWRLPRAVSAVAEYAEYLAPRLGPDARVVAGGRIKHMTPAQNEALGRQFAQVRASLGRQKSRVLHAAVPAPSTPRWPRRRHLGEVGVTVVAHGNVFHTDRLDDGTRLLLRTLTRTGGVPGPGSSRGVALDVGCGSGIIAAWLAQRGWVTTGIDVSWAALDSTRLTAAATRVSVGVRRGDMLVGVPDASADLVVANPPFHVGGAKDSTPTLAMIADAARVLRPGGELWLVFNAHLPYLEHLRRHVGVTTLEARDRHYVVARALREPAP